MIKQYSSYKITIFPSFINTLYWKSLVYHGFYLKSFLPPNTQKSLKALIFSTFLSSPVLSCENSTYKATQTYPNTVCIYEKCYCKYGIVLPCDGSQQ